MSEREPTEQPNNRSRKSGLSLRKPPNLQEFVENLRQEGESDEALVGRLQMEDDKEAAKKDPDEILD